jgi:hypothetical protein
VLCDETPILGSGMRFKRYWVVGGCEDECPADSSAKCVSQKVGIAGYLNSQITPKWLKTEFPHNIAIIDSSCIDLSSQYCAETRF